MQEKSSITITTTSAKQTKDFAKRFAKSLKGIKVITLSGNLGAGKTTFAQGFAEGLNIKNKIISPTFIICRQYPIPNTDRTLYHIDLYRLESSTKDEISSLLEITSSGNPTLIEWPEKLPQILPPEYIEIKIQTGNKNDRKITIKTPVQFQ